MPAFLKYESEQFIPGQMKMMDAVFTDISEISAIMKMIYEIQSRKFYRKELTCKPGSERSII